MKTPPPQRRAKGSGSVYPDRDGFRIEWPIPGQAPGRERVTGSRSEAERVLRDRLRERDEGIVPRDARMTLDQWLDIWLGSHVAAKAQGTQTRYRDISDRLIRPALGRKRLADIDDVVLARYKADLIRGGRTRSGADSILDVLGAALGAATKGSRAPLRVNPRRLVQREHKPRHRVDAPTRADCEALLAAVHSYPLRRAAFALAIGHGLRESEVLGLRRGDRSADGRRLRVQRKAEARTGRLDERPKDASVRDVALLPWVMASLDALGPGAPESLYFPNARDPERAMNPHTLLDWVYEASAGLRKRFTFHDLRRAFGTRIGATHGPATVTAAMGHADYRTSLLYIAPGEIVDDFAPASWPGHYPEADGETMGRLLGEYGGDGSDASSTSGNVIPLRKRAQKA